jgi:hypothetical protein
MEYNTACTIIALREALTNPEVKKVVIGCATQKLSFIKDYLPDGTPCWRQPTQGEIDNYNKESK